MYHSHIRKAQRHLFDTLLTFADDAPVFASEVRTFLDNPVMALASRLIRLRANGHTRLQDAFVAACESVRSVLPQRPETTGWFLTRLATMNKQCEVVVHSNLTLNIPASTLAYQNCFPETIGFFVLTDGLYDEVLANPQAWNPLNRAWKRLKRTNTLSMSKFIRDFTNLPSSVPDHIILTIAERIAQHNKPAELLFANTPEEFVRMYATDGPQSCMQANSSYAKTWKDWMPVECNIVPTVFYSYFPLTKGAYIIRDGRVAARAILYMIKTGDKEKWYYSRLYFHNEGLQKIMIAALNEHGISQCPNNGEPMHHWLANKQVPCSFKIPGYYRRNSKVPFWPYPHLDHGRPNSLGYTWDEDAKEFTIHYGDSSIVKGSVTVGVPSTEGFVEKINKCVCAYCGNIKASSLMVKGLGNYYCNEACVINSGLCIASDGEGTRSVMLVTDAWATTSGEYFTNYQAARRRGAGAVIGMWGTYPECDVLLGFNGNEYKDTTIYTERINYAYVINTTVYKNMSARSANTTKYSSDVSKLDLNIKTQKTVLFEEHGDMPSKITVNGDREVINKLKAKIADALSALPIKQTSFVKTSYKIIAHSTITGR